MYSTQYMYNVCISKRNKAQRNEILWTCAHKTSQIKSLVCVCVCVCVCLGVCLCVSRPLPWLHGNVTSKTHTKSPKCVCVSLYVSLYVCVCLGPPGSTATLHLTRGDKELEPVTLLRVSGPLGVGLLLVSEIRF